MNENLPKVGKKGRKRSELSSSKRISSFRAQCCFHNTHTVLPCSFTGFKKYISATRTKGISKTTKKQQNTTRRTQTQPSFSSFAEQFLPATSSSPSTPSTTPHSPPSHHLPFVPLTPQLLVVILTLALPPVALPSLARFPLQREKRDRRLPILRYLMKDRSSFCCSSLEVARPSRRRRRRTRIRRVLGCSSEELLRRSRT